MYVPRNVPANPAEIPAWLTQELLNIQAALLGPFPFVQLQELHVEPKKTLPGMVAQADGVDWNPGSGPGVYCFRGGSWKFLG